MRSSPQNAFIFRTASSQKRGVSILARPCPIVNNSIKKSGILPALAIYFLMEQQSLMPRMYRRNNCTAGTCKTNKVVPQKTGANGKEKYNKIPRFTKNKTDKPKN